MGCATRCPYDSPNLAFPMGALPVEMGPFMTWPLCCLYMTPSQTPLCPVERMGYNAAQGTLTGEEEDEEPSERFL